MMETITITVKQKSGEIVERVCEVEFHEKLPREKVVEMYCLYDDEKLVEIKSDKKEKVTNAKKSSSPKR